MATSATPLVPVVAYVRMSTEHQQYSTSNQLDKIQEYAARHGMSVVRVYADEGKSGLMLKGREQLQKLLSDVQGEATDFRAILVYDISRWGRFQDADESGYHEFVCRRRGIAVHYCAEQFENDGSPVANIIKSVKRSMAGEYSRELSTKVFQGACRLALLGFRQGGAAGFGLRRMLIDEKQQRRQLLDRGQHKSIQTDRVILVPGPETEQEVVRRMFHAFVNGRKTEREIAAELNSQGVRTDLGRTWTRGVVHQLLTNEKYIGHNVYHRSSFKLKKKHVRNPREMWIRADRAFAPIVSAELFWAAQGIIEARSRAFSDEEMLAKLREVLSRHGRLSGLLIDEHDDTPSTASYRSRFGSLVRAYHLIGYTPEADYAYVEINRILRQQHPQLVERVIRGLRELGASVEVETETDVLIINGEYRSSVVLCRCLETPGGHRRWCIRFEHGNRADITIAVRMGPDPRTIHDFHLLPVIDMALPRLRLAEDNGALLDGYRFDDLSYFFALAERARIESAA